MFLLFVILFLFLLFGILMSISSVFLPFMENVGGAVHYNMAYYGAMSAVERASLALKYHQPGFEGEAGYLGATGNLADRFDHQFAFFQDGDNGLMWNIRSRTSQIPSSGNGNVEYLLSASDSKHYNMLDYTRSEKIFLTYDATSDVNDFYTGTLDIAHFSGDKIEGTLRLPPKVKDLFSGSQLCDVNNVCLIEEDEISDPMMVNRFFDGIYNGQSFSILPTIEVFAYSGWYVDYPLDNAIRASHLQSDLVLNFGSSYSPLSTSNLNSHNLVTSDYNALSGLKFSDIFKSNLTTGLSFSFGLVHLFRTVDGLVYPFLEYQLRFPQEVADRFFTIEGVGRVGEYDVKILLKKPSFQGPVYGDFTVVF